MKDEPCCDPCGSSVKVGNKVKPELVCLIDTNGCILHPVIKTVVSDTEPVEISYTHMGEVVIGDYRETACPPISMSVISGCNPVSTTEPPSGVVTSAFPLPDKCIEVMDVDLNTEIMYGTPIVSIGTNSVPSVTHYLDNDGQLITGLVTVLPDCDCIDCITCS